MAFRDELYVVEQYAFFIDMGGVRGHGPRSDATDVGMVASRGDVELGAINAAVDIAFGSCPIILGVPAKA